MKPPNLFRLPDHVADCILRANFITCITTPSDLSWPFLNIVTLNNIKASIKAFIQCDNFISSPQNVNAGFRVSIW